MTFAELLGQKLLKGEKEVGVDALAGKVVGLYFSAHWCPPCRGFTPVLAEKYKELQAAGKEFEIVFCSSDKDEGQFKEYYAEMPWLALPFADRELKNKLSKKFKVSGIPALILLDTDGSVITTKGRNSVSVEKVVEAYPFKPPTLEESLGAVFQNSAGEEVTLKSLQEAGTNIALYFSAHWCPPCKMFTPELTKTYKKIKESGKPFEVIFVSSDRDEGSFTEYYGEMPWLALPYAERKKKEQLSEHFEVQGIPSLVMLDSKLNVINKNARGSVGSDKTGEKFPWYPPEVVDLEECEDLNDATCVVLMMEEAADDWDSMEATLAKVAKEFRATKGDADDMSFVVAKEGGGIAGQVRKLFKMGKAGSEVELVLMDLGDSGAYHVHKGKVDEAAIRSMMEQHKAGKLELSHLQ